MKVFNKKIKTKLGLTKILSIQFDNDSTEFNALMNKLHTHKKEMISSGADAVEIGTMEHFIQALYDHYNEYFNNTFLWQEELHCYTDLLPLIEQK